MSAQKGNNSFLLMCYAEQLRLKTVKRAVLQCWLLLDNNSYYTVENVILPQHARCYSWLCFKDHSVCCILACDCFISQVWKGSTFLGNFNSDVSQLTKPNTYPGIHMDQATTCCLNKSWFNSSLRLNKIDKGIYQCWSLTIWIVPESYS